MRKITYTNSKLSLEAFVTNSESLQVYSTTNEKLLSFEDIIPAGSPITHSAYNDEDTWTELHEKLAALANDPRHASAPDGYFGCAYLSFAAGPQTITLSLDLYIHSPSR